MSLILSTFWLALHVQDPDDAVLDDAFDPATASQMPDTDPPWNCDDPQVQQEMNYCMHLEYLEADRLLNEEWAGVVAAMKLRDENYDSTYDDRPGYYETLLAGQRAWLQYRDAQCAVEGYWARGGSLEPLLVSSCLRSLTELRTEELRELTDEPN